MGFNLTNASKRVARALGGVVGVASKSWQGITKAYEAGRNERIDSDFAGVRGQGPNLAADMTLRNARARVRWLVDNHPLIRGAAQTILDNVVGTGIAWDFDTPFDDVNEQLEEAREEFGYCEGVDVGREVHEAEQQRLAWNEVFSGGEVLVHNGIAPAWGDHGAGPCIELFDAERLELGWGVSGLGMAPRTSATGNSIRQAVEVDSLGRRVAYHVMSVHPDDGDMLSGAPIRVRRIASEDARLIFLRRRVGQLRGVPLPVSAVLLTRFAQRFGEAALAQAMSAACMGVFIKGVTSPDIVKKFGKEIALDMDGEPLTELEPGMIGLLPQGADVVQVGNNMPSPQFVSVNDWLERQQSRGIGLGFAEYTGDWGRMTYSSSRSESLASRKFYRPLQGWFSGQYCWWGARAFTRFAVAMNKVKLTAEQRRKFKDAPLLLYKIRCQPNGWEWVDPKSEASAADIELSRGLTSPQKIVSNRGDDWYRLTDERLEAEAYVRERRIELGLPPEPAPPGTAPPQNGPQNGPRNGPSPADPNADPEEQRRNEPAKPQPGRAAIRRRIDHSRSGQHA